MASSASFREASRGASYPTRIYLTGFMGSGKSTVGPRVAHHLGYRFVDLDDAVERKAGRLVQDIFAEGGEAAFRALEAEVLAETTAEEAVVVAVGGGALTFEANVQLARRSGLVVYLQVAPEELARRLKQSQVVRPLLHGPDGRRLSESALQERIAGLLEEREAFYRRAHVTLETGGLTVEQAIAAVLAAVRAGRPEA